MSSKPVSGPGTTFLTGPQAAQILEKLKGIKNVEGQTIKIQTLQINPQTGAKQIVAIPIQSASAAAGQNQNLSVSPMKTLRTSDVGGGSGSGGSNISGSTTSLGPFGGGRTIKISSPRTVAYSGMRVSGVMVQPAVTGTSQSKTPSSPQVIHTLQQSTSSGPVIQGVHTLNTAVQGVQSLQTQQPVVHRVTLTPQKAPVATAVHPRFPRQNLQFESVSMKRPADHDPLEVSDPKRRKTEKGTGCFVVILSSHFMVYTSKLPRYIVLSWSIRLLSPAPFVFVKN